MMHFDLFAEPATLARVVAVFRGVMRCPDLELSLPMPLEEIPGWDSMWHVSVMTELETRFSVVLEPHEMEEVQTVGDVVRLIGARRALEMVG